MRQSYDPTGALTYAASYDPYGNPLEQYGLGGALGFTGEHTDANGLQYLRARYYNPALGTFLSRDPVMGMVGGQSIRWNPYSYAGANPVNYVDPSGRIFWLAVLLGAPLIGGISMAAWNVTVEQGFGIGGRNQLNFSAINWSPAFSRGLEGVELGLNIGVGYATGIGIGALGLKGWWAFGANAAADFSFGVGWDMLVHGAPVSSAFLTNAIGFGFGEILGTGTHFFKGAWRAGRAVWRGARNTLTFAGDVVASLPEVIREVRATHSRVLTKPHTALSPVANTRGYRTNLERAWPQPNAGATRWDAAHIVPKEMDEGTLKFINNWGINEHSPANLTWLPRDLDPDWDIVRQYFDPAPVAHHGMDVHANRTLQANAARLRLAEKIAFEDWWAINGGVSGPMPISFGQPYIIGALTDIANDWLHGVVRR